MEPKVTNRYFTKLSEGDFCSTPNSIRRRVQLQLQLFRPGSFILRFAYHERGSRDVKGWEPLSWIVGNRSPAGNMPSVDLQPAHDQKPFKSTSKRPLTQVETTSVRFADVT